MTRTEFFEALQNGAKWDVGVSIARTNPLPLDANSVFESLEALTGYATTNPLAYPGQICSVIGETEVTAYQIATVGTDALVNKLAASNADGSGGIEGAVTELQTKVAHIIDGTTVVKKAEQDSKGNKISETYATQADLTTAQNRIKAIEDSDHVNILNGVKVNQLVAGTPTVTELTIDGEKKVTIDLSGYATLEDANAIPKFAVKVVDALPTADISTSTIYLVPCEGHDPGVNDTHDEYIYANDKWEKIGNTDVDLSSYSTTEQMNAAITTAIQGLDITDITVDASKTVKKVSEADGKIAVETQDIQIATSQVTNLDTRLTDLTTLEGIVGKAAEGETPATGLQKQLADVIASDATKQTADQVNTLIQAATISGDKVDGAVAEAKKVTNALTIGEKVFDGHEAVTITSSDLGLTGHTETDLERAVKLDTAGKAYVTIPAAMLYDVAADRGLEKSVSEDGTTTSFGIKNDGILTAMIKDAQVTDAKIKDVNVNKLVQSDGDTLVLDGGNAAGQTPQA